MNNATKKRLLQKMLKRLQTRVKTCKLCGKPFFPSGRQSHCVDCMMNRYRLVKKGDSVK